CHLHPSPALRDGQDGMQGIPGHPPMEGISSRIFLVYNFTAYDHQWTEPRQVVPIAYPGGQGAVMSLDEMNEEWWCDLPSASFPVDTVSNTKWVQYIELSTDVV